jgi:hypothetical protein
MRDNALLMVNEGQAGCASGRGHEPDAIYKDTDTVAGHIVTISGTIFAQVWLGALV